MTARPATPASVPATAIADVHTCIVELIKAWSHPKEHYADLRSQARTISAHNLVRRILAEIEEREHQAGRRVRKRRVASGVKFEDALERFVGDLLRVRADATAPALVYRATGKAHFDFDPVKYDVFQAVLWGLLELELIGRRKGQTRYVKYEFEPGQPRSYSLPGHASRFWATGKLIGLAQQFGINSRNVARHFVPEPPQHPLVLKDRATGVGRYRESGARIEYKRTPETDQLEQDIRDLNNFLAQFEITGGEHHGYIREFNNRSWKKGGRLYSPGEGSYQQLTEAQRLKMTINGEPVAEIDIKASQLTIYHARVGEPLKGSDDPYALAGVDREIAKLWTVASFGSGKPITRWPVKMAEEYKKKNGKDLGKQAKASKVGEKMLAALPALKKLRNYSDLWGRLQYLEAEAVIGTMLVLMREHGVPSLSMHDGLIVPKSQADLAEGILKQEFRRVVGVTPILTVDAPEPVLVTDL